MAPFVLKFKGNKSFSPFSQLSDTDSLTRTWKVCTKVASHLEQGQRLENLSWRCWFLHSLMVEADNAKSKREFKKMTKSMGEKLDKEKGRSIEELQAPDFKGNDATSKVKQRAEEKERSRDGHTDGQPSMKGMQYTFSVAPPATSTSTTVSRPPIKKAATSTSFSQTDGADHVMTPAQDTPSVVQTDPNRHDDTFSASQQFQPSDIQLPASPIEVEDTTPQASASQNLIVPSQRSSFSSVVRFPTLFSSDFSPTALLGSGTAMHSNPRMSYGEDVIGVGMDGSGRGSFSVPRPAFEFPLDELMDSPDPRGWTRSDDEMREPNPPNPPRTINDLPNLSAFRPPIVYDQSQPTQQGPTITKQEPPSLSLQFSAASSDQFSFQSQRHPPMTISPTSPDLTSHFVPPSSVPNLTSTNVPTAKGRPRSSSKHHREEDAFLPPPPISSRSTRHSHSASVPQLSSQGTDLGMTSTVSTAPSRRNSLKGGSRHAPPSATPPPRTQRAAHGNTAPGGVKSECANCGATSTPLWRRGLNDELNCNACGLFAKLHKRARPKSMRPATTETATRQPGWGVRRDEPVEGETVSCYNCNTTATPLWRKDEGGRTLCNACGLYLKLHGERRPSTMKSEVIRKRARHEGRKGTTPSDTPSASPGASARASPALGPSPAADPSFHPPMLPPASYDFSASGFEFHQVTHDTTDRLTKQHDTEHLGDTALGMTFSPGASYLETLQYPGTLSSGYNPQASFYSHTQAEGRSSDDSSTRESLREDQLRNQTAFQDDGNKRRRVSPESDKPQASNGSEMGSSFSPSTTTFDMDTQGSTSFDGSPNVFDPFSSLFPYPFTFAPTPSGYLHPPMTSYSLLEEPETNDGMESQTAF